MTMEESAFPRGRLQVPEETAQRSESKRKSTDVLFGAKNADSSSSGKKKQRRKKELSGSDDATKKSLLPMGGGAVVTPHKGDPYIEPLSFSRFAKGFALLAVVKEVHEELVIFSLPNQWTGFMMRNQKDKDHDKYTLDRCLESGQMLSVRIVKAAQESAAGGKKTIRRIEVTVDPSRVNTTDSSINTGGLRVRGQIISVEDHGILIDLGLQRRGFLPFDNIEGSYTVEESDDDADDETKGGKQAQWNLLEGRIMDFVVRSGNSNAKIVPLQLPSISQMAQHMLPSGHTPTLQGLSPGTLVRATVESIVRNGLCVTFGGGIFRGAIEVGHLGTYWIPTQRTEADDWKAIFNKHRSVVARIIAVDSATKIVRLSMLPHLLDQRLPSGLPKVGTIVPDATVIRLDPGIGALLALNATSENKEPDNDKRLHKPLLKDEIYMEASKVKAVYVHILKAMDPNGGRVDDAEFAKAFAPSTTHSVRILSTSNMIEGIASGGAADSILSAHILQTADLVPGKIYKQVPISAQLDCGGVLVDFGMGIRGMVPAVHLFDQVSNTEFRAKTRKIKYNLGSKIDVRVLTVDPASKKCMLTAKKSLLKTDDIISSFEGLKIGQRGTGFVSKIDEVGITVTFFNGVYGVVTARSVRRQLAVENHREAYSLGDVVDGFISNLKRVNRSGKSRRAFWEITFGLQSGDSDDMQLDDLDEAAEKMVNLRSGVVLPSKSLRVHKLVNGKERNKSFVPGYAIVGAKAKYLFDEAECSTLLPEFELKLPYDQLFDHYDTEFRTAAELDEYACQALTVGRKINGKAVVLTAPVKSRLEWFNATGQLPVVSLRPSFIDHIERKSKSSEETEGPFIPLRDSRLFVGAQVMGYVGTIDPRYGAFVQFLDGRSGLVPRKRGGLALPLYGSITCIVVAVDSDSQSEKILLKPNDEQGKKGSKTSSVSMKDCPFAAGDVIDEAEVTKIDFYRAYLSIGEKSNGFPIKIHCSMANEISTLCKELSVKKTSKAVKDKITDVHPFHGWKIGKKLYKLTVVSIGPRGIEVSNRTKAADIMVGNPTAGTVVCGVVSGVSRSKQGLWVMIDPETKGFLDGLEISSDIELLNSLEHSFPPGTCLESHVLRSTHKNKKILGPELSILDKSGESWAPKSGELGVGRVNLRKGLVRPPCLMVDLRGGLAGRCCITELKETEEWSNFPLGNDSRKGEESCPISTGTYIPLTLLETCDPKQNVLDVSFRSSRKGGATREEEPPKPGATVKGYVIHTNQKGCFIRISRAVEGRSTLKELCDGFLPNPASSYPPGRLVVAKIKSVKPGTDPSSAVKFVVDLDMRESTILGSDKTMKFDDIKVGEKYKGSVSRLEDYGVFVKLDKTNVSGLCHKSECSDKYVKRLSDFYDPSDQVKILVIKKDEVKRTLGFSMKASHFENDEESSDESSSEGMSVDGDNDAESTNNDVAGSMIDRDRAESSDSEASDDDSSDSDSTGSSSDNEAEEKIDEAGAIAMDTDVGFDWERKRVPKDQNDSDSESDGSSGSDDEEGGEKTRSSHKSRKKQAARRKEEQEIDKRERALADGTADENPETAADFERLLASQPNSSEIWIRYMAFHISLADIEAARQVAARALDKIEFRQEGEKLNIWTALLALESKYGSPSSLEQATQRACQHSNPKQVYLRLCEMTRKEADVNPSMTEKADALFSKMCKKFKSKKTVWLSHAEYLLSTRREDEAQALLKRAMMSLPAHKHVETMSKFAQMVFEHGSSEKARTLFDGILMKNPKRLDLLFVYADKEVKHGDVGAARSLFRKVSVSKKGGSLMKLSEKKMKKLFKRWYVLEENHGTPMTQEEVKTAAREYIEST